MLLSTTDQVYSALIHGKSQQRIYYWAYTRGFQKSLPVPGMHCLLKTAFTYPCEKQQCEILNDVIGTMIKEFFGVFPHM